jgi:hypothetical protein
VAFVKSTDARKQLAIRAFGCPHLGSDGILRNCTGRIVDASKLHWRTKLENLGLMT